MWTNDFEQDYNSLNRPTNEINKEVELSETIKQEQEKVYKKVPDGKGGFNFVEDIDAVEVEAEVEVVEATIVDDAVDSEVLEADEILADGEEAAKTEYTPTPGRILEIKSAFTTLQDEASVNSKKLAATINMLELDETNEFITTSIMDLQALTQSDQKIETQGIFKRGLLALPGAKTFAGAFGAIKEETKKSTIANGTIEDAAEKLFGVIEGKKDTIERTTLSIMTIEESREANLGKMLAMESEVKAILDDPNTTAKESFQARNMYIQVQEAIMQSQTKIDQVATILEVAQASTYSITSLLPNIKANFLDDMAINAGLNHLLQYKSIYDSTVALVNDIQDVNADKINQAMLDVVDVTISVAQTDRLALIGAKRIEGHKKLVAITSKQVEKQQKSIETLEGIRAETDLLGSRQAAALISQTSSAPDKSA